MQIEVHNKKKVAVGCDVHGCREITECRFADHGVVFGRILPDQSERATMCDGDVIELPIGRDNDAVWTIYVHGHIAGVDLMIYTGAIRAETNQSNLIGG